MDELAAGIYGWTAPHPEWRPKVEEVEWYALVAGEALLLIDPLVPAEEDERRSPLLCSARTPGRGGDPRRAARHDPVPHA